MSDTNGKDTYILEIKGISKSFPGVKALNNVDLRVRPGSVHALMGENGAGKSTLMKCILGIYKPDSGEMYFDGKKVFFQNPKAAMDGGISMVHQELNQVPKRSVMENIWLGRFPMHMGCVDKKAMYTQTKDIFEKLDIDINPRAVLESLSVSQRQMIEIAKAVSYNAKLIIFDEPTSSLTEQETEKLFKVINQLRSEGVSMIYISHKMDEIKRISDEVTILRDGTFIKSAVTSEITNNEIISLMVGRTLANLFPEKTTEVSDEVLLKVENLTGEYEPCVHDVSFELHKGEILGIAGLVGSRRTELLELLFGLRTRKSGTVTLNGKVINNKNPRAAIQNGFTLLTEERRKTGIFPILSVQFNTVAAHLKSYVNKLGFLDQSKVSGDTQEIIDKLRIKTPQQSTKIGTLSGGNQQKVILGRWLLNDYEVVMLDEPTRGIDVGAKYEIYQIIMDIAAQNKGVLVVSSEMSELLGIADRILVMSNGRVGGFLNREQASQEEILKLSIKYL